MFRAFMTKWSRVQFLLLPLFCRKVKFQNKVG
ncbi:hypothetical protein GLYMA_17G228451v4 [Glycine max]|nr:hypothetical protein GLYMA_17G228451v4 [Glycine max]KAH1119697.1 hypothetical protein GYH30_048183 [Glycine max]